MSLEPKPLAFSSLTGISEKTLSIHHDKLYTGYITKANEISEKLRDLCEKGDFTSANQTYSELRGLKQGETFAIDAIYLHEWYFDTLGGDGKPSGQLVDDLIAKYGSLEGFVNYFSACGMAARGWVVLCWDTKAKDLLIYNCDTHHQGGIWGCLPVLVLDVYEHAYFIDYGSDRKSYIADWWKNLNWAKANELYEKTKSIK